MDVRTALWKWTWAVAIVASRAAATDSTTPDFSHDLLDTVLTHHVDADGGVAYQRLAGDRVLLDRYLDSLAACSPRNRPERFGSDAHRLAYWINAYNAFVLHGVLDVFPIASVSEVEGGLEAFFRQQRFVAGSDSLTLDQIENSIIRPGFTDPRIHFAVNCAAASCPALDTRAYHAADIDSHLDRQARRFAGDPQHVRLVGDLLRVSTIMEWYGADFVNWFPSQRLADPPEHPGLTDYLLLYLPREEAQRLRSAGDVRLEFADYDWTLNRAALEVEE